MNKGKITKIIKSRITIGVVCFLLGGAILGGISNSSTEQKVTENQVSQEQSKEDAPKDKEELPTMELNKTYTVSGSNGKYNITIEGIRFTDKRNEFSDKKVEKVMFLDFNYENVDSTDEVYISDMDFKIMDDEGNVLETYPVSDENRNSQRLPMGGKCKASATFGLPKASKNLKVLFYDNMFGKPTAQITIATGL